MKRTLFLVHDPGGHDAVYPVVKRFFSAGLDTDFYCAGPAADLNRNYGCNEQEILEKLNEQISARAIRLLVTGSSWGSQLEMSAIRICREANVKTASILDYWSNYALRFTVCSSRETIYPDYYIVMDNLARTEALAQGVPEAIIRVLGQPGLDGFLQAGCYSRKKFRDHNKKVLFLSQPLSGLYGTILGYSEKQVLRDCIRAVKAYKRWEFSVKFHPKDSEDLKRIYGSFSIEKNAPLSELLPEYDIVVGMNSIGLLYAVLMGVPAISYQPGLTKPDLCITNKLGFTRVVTDYETLLTELDEALQRSSVAITEELREKYLWLDGRSTDRVFCFLRGVGIDGEN